MAAVAGAALAAKHAVLAPGPLAAASDVTVPPGGTARIATALRAQDVIASAALFRLAAFATRANGPLHAAELAFPAHASVRDVLAVLRTAPQVQHALTIPEGLTARQITAILDADATLSGPTPTLAEGYVLPQTYFHTLGARRAGVVARAHAALIAALDREWAARAPGLPLSSPRDAVILASIVERETGRPGERPHVASVFLNRLRLGMRLQSDPTTIYVASHALGTLDHKLTRAELAQDDPYNTYRAPGLPPGPICAPGLASLQAVLHPADSLDLYFVADGSGGHVFARTLAEQTRNVAQSRQTAQ